MPYRNADIINNSVKFNDFVNYYYDAIAIGFSKRKAMKYAWECCLIDVEKLASIYGE